MDNYFVPIVTLVMIGFIILMGIEQLTGSLLLAQLICAIPLGGAFGLYLINEIRKVK